MPSDGTVRYAGWDRVIGQERVKAFLRNAIRGNRLAHAYLFSGPDGAGMDAVAIELARALLCARGTGEACGSCNHCNLSSILQHPDIHLCFLLPVGRGEAAGDDPLARLTPQELEAVRREVGLKARDPYHDITIPRANQIKVNSVRGIRRQASLGSFDEGRKVFIVLDAGRMTTEASNALLKTLEEPAPGTHILLTTAEPDSLLPTVVSRCQHLRFDPLGEAAIASALSGGHGIPGARAAMVAKLSAGSFSAAIRLAGEDLDSKRNAAVEMLRSFLHKPPRDVLDLIRADADAEKEDTVAKLILLQAWIRDAMLISVGRPAHVNADDAPTLEKFVRQYPSLDYASVSDSIDRAVSDLRKNVYIHLILHALRVDLRRAARR